MDIIRVLILSSKFGEGHYQAGEALSQQFKAQAAVTVCHLDFGSFFYKKMDYLMRRTYLNMVQRTPEIWRLIYERTLDSTLGSWRKFVYGRGAKNLLAYIAQYDPDIIVSTHFIPAGILADLKGQGKLSVPLVTVITDYLVHGVWVHPEVDLYVIGCQDAWSRLRQAGVIPDKIIMSGIPVRTGFLNKPSKADCRRQLGLEQDVRTVLLMGGSTGLAGQEIEILESLLTLTKLIPVQFLVVCGSNQELFATLAEKHAKQQKIKVKVFGYVNNIHQLMAASDLVITKGGALTISEALTSGLPLLMYKPIPGHEEGNASFVVKGGAGIKVESSHDLGQWAAELLTDQAKLEAMSTAASRLLPSRAAEKAAETILRSAQKAPGNYKTKEIG